MSIMGWSSAAMAARYQHVLDSIRKGVADQVGGLLWDNPDDDQADETEERSESELSGERTPAVLTRQNKLIGRAR
jgi:hypothetical protein